MGEEMARLVPAVLGALIGMLGLAGPASADDQVHFTLKVDRHVLYGGQSLTATASAKGVCDWILEWNGDRRHVKATSFSTTYVAPRITKRTKIPLHATCVAAPARRNQASRAAAPAGDAQAIVVRIPAHTSHTAVITVLPPGSAVNPPDIGGGVDGAGGLPNTGGPSWWLLVAGLGALVVGGATVRRTQA